MKKQAVKLTPTFLPVSVWVTTTDKPDEKGRFSKGEAITTVNREQSSVSVYFEPELLNELGAPHLWALVAHEAYHVVEFTYALIGEEEHGSEMTAYFLQFLVTEIHEALAMLKDTA